MDNFTLDISQVDAFKRRMQKYFADMMALQNSRHAARIHQARQQQALQQPQQPPQQPSQTQRPPRPQQLQQPQQLSATNLQQQQDALNLQRVASIQKSHANSNRPPAAPTTREAPFPFGLQSPQGVPQIYALKNELTQDKLVLPATKKRKNNNNQASPAATPSQIQNITYAKSSPLPKPASPEKQRAPTAPVLIKCPVEGCNSNRAGFATKGELDKHSSEVHDPTHNIKDPMDAAMYAIESLRLALNLDENGKCKPLTPDMTSEKAPQQAAAMKVTASSQSVKQEVTTPMSRNPTQTGPSPSKSLLKTPQGTGNVKTPVSETKSLFKNPPALAKAASVSASSKITAPEAPPDGWANSHVSKEWFGAVFGGCANLNRSVPHDVTKSWLARNPFTPVSTPSSAALSKDSPHRSDISPSENLNVNINVEAGDSLEDDWVMNGDWFDDGLQGGMADLGVGDMMEWEALFEDGPEEDKEEIARLEKNEWGAPVEFLKSHDPGKLEELKRQQKEMEGRRRR